MFNNANNTTSRREAIVHSLLNTHICTEARSHYQQMQIPNHENYEILKNYLKDAISLTAINGRKYDEQWSIIGNSRTISELSIVNEHEEHLAISRSSFFEDGSLVIKIYLCIKNKKPSFIYKKENFMNHIKTTLENKREANS